MRVVTITVAEWIGDGEPPDDTRHAMVFSPEKFFDDTGTKREDWNLTHGDVIEEDWTAPMLAAIASGDLVPRESDE